jgi:hypothetical protein
MQMSPFGTSRRFAVTHRLGRYRRHSGHEWPRRLIHGDKPMPGNSDER